MTEIKKYPDLQISEIQKQDIHFAYIKSHFGNIRLQNLQYIYSYPIPTPLSYQPQPQPQLKHHEKATCSFTSSSQKSKIRILNKTEPQLPLPILQIKVNLTRNETEQEVGRMASMHVTTSLEDWLNGKENMGTFL